MFLVANGIPKTLFYHQAPPHWKQKSWKTRKSTRYPREQHHHFSIGLIIQSVLNRVRVLSQPELDMAQQEKVISALALYRQANKLLRTI